MIFEQKLETNISPPQFYFSFENYCEPQQQFSKEKQNWGGDMFVSSLYSKNTGNGYFDMIFFPVKAEISDKKMVEISSGNTLEISAI